MCSKYVTIAEVQNYAYFCMYAVNTFCKLRVSNKIQK